MLHFLRAILVWSRVITGCVCWRLWLPGCMCSQLYYRTLYSSRYRGARRVILQGDVNTGHAGCSCVAGCCAVAALRSTSAWLRTSTPHSPPTPQPHTPLTELMLFLLFNTIPEAGAPAGCYSGNGPRTTTMAAAGRAARTVQAGDRTRQYTTIV